MNSVVISLGSNTCDSRQLISRAIHELLPELIALTEPYSDSTGYLNVVARLLTPITYDALRARFKIMERQAGRKPGSKGEGGVPLDIDIVIFEGEVMRSKDVNQAYFKHGAQLLSLTTK